ncbi:MAG: glycosyltransferase family 2 protein [Nitrosomonas sp.]|nr:glycosyltransferase family 2 protein [Nitrosomonas sp.]
MIVVNYNAGRILTQCVTHALKQARQVVVVDNDSADTSIADLKAHFPDENRLIIHHSSRNLGFSAGCNIGCKKANELATERYILFLNPDCMLEPGSLKHLLQALEADPEAGMAGGHIQNPDGSEQGGGRRDVPSPWRAFVRASGLYRLEKFWPELFPDFHLHKKPLPDKPIEVEATAGAMMLVRREALQEVGGWDEGYFLHCEDLYLCMRFRQKGWRILFVPDAKAIHYQGTCSQARPIFVAWHKHKGMIRFYKKFLKKVHAHFIRQRLVIKKPASDQIEPVFKANTSQDRISRIVRQYAYRAISGQYYRFHDRVCTRC